jgi:hypothetical protein
LKLDEHGYSPTALGHILCPSAGVKSHHKAAKLLAVLDGLPISGRHGNRLAEAIGLAMAAQRDGAVGGFVHHRRQPPTAPAPAVAVIGLEAQMNDPASRRQGLPARPSLVRSLIKESPYRAKGTEASGDNPDGAEAIRHVRAAALSDDNRPETCPLSRPASATRRHEGTEFRQAA